MKKTSVAALIAFVVGCLLTSATFSGRSEPADRTLTIHQLQHSETYNGKFLIDTSELPENAIESLRDEPVSGKSGKPSTQISLNSKYEIEVVLRLVSRPDAR